MFRSVITVFAGYWKPTWRTRMWVALFFLSVRLQARLGFAPPHTGPAAHAVPRSVADHAAS